MGTVTFYYKEKMVNECYRYDRTGIIAEDIEQIIPETVNYIINNENNRIPDSVDYSKFVPYLIKMVQIQQKEIEVLKNK